jgi:predicted transcriptional regulator
VRILRDLAHSSRVLLLLELKRRPARTLRPLARALGLTHQAVSIYIGQLEDEGLVIRLEDGLRITPKGREFLEGEVASLKAFADRAARDVVRVETCVAIAAVPIKAGDKVFLHMLNGRLVADPRLKSPSRGVAHAGAEPGAALVVGGLQGIVKIHQATLRILEVRSPGAGNAASPDRAWLHARAAQHEGYLWAALDEVGEGALAGIDLPWHFEFAPQASAAAAVARGASPTYVGAPETVARLVADIEGARAEGKLPGFEYLVERAPRARGQRRRKR